MAASGAVNGRLLNFLLGCLSKKSSIVAPQLFCLTCHKRLRRQGLVPILGQFLILGRCPQCGTSLPLRILFLEAFTAVAFGYVAMTYKSTLFPEGAVLLLYICVLLTIATFDLEHQIVPDKLVYPALPVSLLLAPWAPLGFMLSAKDAYISAFLGNGLA